MSKPGRLEDFLEDTSTLHFYNLMGGLADNLMCDKRHGGTFLSCDCCGDTFTLKDRSWSCERCDSTYELKFQSTPQTGAPITRVETRRVEVAGVTKTRIGVLDHWYFLDENWCVAEFFNQILRLPPDLFLVEWLAALGVALPRPAGLESLLHWPRLRFGPKTIQPDFVASYEHDLVLFEFKRPKGGVVPGKEIMGQIAFALQTAKQLDRRWHLVLNPGRNSLSTKSAEAYAIEAVTALKAAQDNWKIPDETVQLVQALSITEIASHITVVGWEQLIQAARDVIEAGTALPESMAWTRAYVLQGLQYFQTARASRGVMDAVSAQEG